jgi:hypothetical protein
VSPSTSHPPPPPCCAVIVVLESSALARPSSYISETQNVPISSATSVIASSIPRIDSLHIPLLLTCIVFPVGDSSVRSNPSNKSDFLSGFPAREVVDGVSRSIQAQVLGTPYQQSRLSNWLLPVFLVRGAIKLSQMTWHGLPYVLFPSLRPNQREIFIHVPYLGTQHIASSHPQVTCVQCALLVYVDEVENHYLDSPNHPSCLECNLGFVDDVVSQEARTFSAVLGCPG